MVDRFIADAEVFADLADQFDEGDPDATVKDIERMISAADILGGIIDARMTGIPEASLDGLARNWSSKGIGAISGAACEALKGWNSPDEAVSGASKTYVELYFQQGL